MRLTQPDAAPNPQDAPDAAPNPQNAPEAAPNLPDATPTSDLLFRIQCIQYSSS